jgi:hypothetical protein
VGRHRLLVVALLLGIQILGLSHHAWASFEPVPVPEPSMLSLFAGSGLACFAVKAWRRLRWK